MPQGGGNGTPGETALDFDAADRERYGLAVAQVVNTVSGALKTPDGGLFDAAGFDEIEVAVVLYSKGGSPTSCTVAALESDTNTAAGQTVVPGAQVAFTGSDLAAKAARAFRVRWVGRKRFFGVQVEVAGGTSVGVALLARGVNARETALARAPSSVLQGATLA